MLHNAFEHFLLTKHIKDSRNNGVDVIDQLSTPLFTVSPSAEERRGGRGKMVELWFIRFMTNLKPIFVYALLAACCYLLVLFLRFWQHFNIGNRNIHCTIGRQFEHRGK